LRFRAQFADFNRSQPNWLRAVALFCVFLIGSVSTAQAAHIHGQWLPKNSPEITKHAAGPAASTEDACPLCVAMHSALPAQMPVVVPSIVVEAVSLPAQTTTVVASVWHFELFSRPPPALL
jgi:hypothetical protein